MRAMNEGELHWVTALVEGEGCITRQITTVRSAQYKYWLVTVGSTDYDVLKRLMRWTLCGRIYKQKVGPKPGGGPRKPVWQWRVYRQQEVLDLLVAIEPLLCRRRRARALEALADLRGRTWRESRRPPLVGIGPHNEPLFHL